MLQTCNARSENSGIWYRQHEIVKLLKNSRYLIKRAISKVFQKNIYMISFNRIWRLLKLIPTLSLSPDLVYTLDDKQRRMIKNCDFLREGIVIIPFLEKAGIFRHYTYCCRFYFCFPVFQVLKMFH